ncbi:hypothetical protein Pint_31768 [Pistacia integerrima]|uniref:Uncharacterized protein n=1 Tax=Pistacia integerrima TaxID=434235 RepID=A0ACC0XQE3_9ROSI|nr:hypothetical protein Pint_31768 [Pistacia integerrima]
MSRQTNWNRRFHASPDVATPRLALLDAATPHQTPTKYEPNPNHHFHASPKTATFRELRIKGTTTPEKVPAKIGSSAKDFVMVLTYARKAQGGFH